MAEIIQGTPEWHAIRAGKVTASRIADLMAKTKSGWGASRSTYMGQLIAERLTGTTAEGFSSAEMRWGTDNEPAARELYEFGSDSDIDQVGFVVHPKIAMSGASPDGLVGDLGLVEIKCPLTKTHIETIISGEAPTQYGLQMQWQLACTGRAWCDFVSYDPRLPSDMRLFKKRVHRDGALIAELEREVVNFIAELDRKIADLRDAVTRKAA